MDETRKALENFEVTELDDRDLEGVSGGAEASCTNGNCSCPPGTYDPNGCSNSNCPKPPLEE
jgi:hypothetical protein